MKKSRKKKLAEVRLHSPKWKMGVMLVASIIFVALGAFLIHHNGINSENGWVGLACVLFFGLCGIVFGMRVLARHPYLILDDDGLTFDGRPPRLPWRELDGFVETSVRGSKALGLILKEDAAYPRQLTGLRRFSYKLNATTNQPPVAISSTLIDMPLSELADLIEKQIRRSKV